MRFVWALFGLLALGAGLIGIVLPLIPTVPFLLLAAFCFARSSERLHDWLVHHPKLGPPIRDWNRSGVIRRNAKIFATISVAAAFSLSVYIGLRPQLLAIQAVTLGCVMLFIWTRPSE
jgi:uncharacterized membrane protein YbaN (DUF454 family)